MAVGFPPAILLTHTHADHIAALNHFYDSYGVPLYRDALEVSRAPDTPVEESAAPVDVIERFYGPRVIKWSITKVGALRHSTFLPAVPFPATTAISICPRRPCPSSATATPSAHRDCHLPDAGVMVCGDAMVTEHPTVSGYTPSTVVGDFSSLTTCRHLRPVGAFADLAPDVFIAGHIGLGTAPIKHSRRWGPRTSRTPELNAQDKRGRVCPC